MLPRQDGHIDIEDSVAASGHHADLAGLQQTVHGVNILRRHLGQHFQLQILPSGGKACGGSGLNTFQSPGVGNGDGLHIFDDIAADLHPALLRHGTQSRPGLGGSQGDGNRLRAAHGGDQLLLQNLHIAVIMGCTIHVTRLLIVFSDYTGNPTRRQAPENQRNAPGDIRAGFRHKLSLRSSKGVRLSPEAHPTASSPGSLP